MVTKHRRARAKVTVLLTALAAMLAFSAIAAGAAQAWHIEGKTLAERGVKQMPFMAQGSTTWSIPGWDVAMSCEEEGIGTISGESALSEEVSLENCSIEGAEEICTVGSPIKLHLATGSDGKVRSTNAPTLTEFTVSGEECPFESGGGPFWIRDPWEGFKLAFGPEALAQNVQISALAGFGNEPLYISGTSNWRLVPEKKWGP